MKIDLKEVPVPEGLEQAVLARVAQSARRVRARRLAAFFAVQAVSLVVLVISLRYVAGSLSASGVWAYVSLALSEGVGALAYARELALATLESLPVLGLAAVFAACSAMAWSASGTGWRSALHMKAS